MLNVISVISNPCLFNRRYQLMREFISRMERTPNVSLYIVELVYGDQIFAITEENNSHHLQLRTNTVMWHKENMINLGVEKLLPSDWSSFAWIDGDLEFENVNWPTQTLEILQRLDIVQLFSYVNDMNINENTIQICSSAGHQYSRKTAVPKTNTSDYWHPGYAWAITRDAYYKIGGLYEKCILGSGDKKMLDCILGVDDTIDMKNLKFGHIPGVIRHFYHGRKFNRKYTERHEITRNAKFNPDTFVYHNENGILEATEFFTDELKNNILRYFSERNEDEYLEYFHINIPNTVLNYGDDIISAMYGHDEQYVDVTNIIREIIRNGVNVTIGNDIFEFDPCPGKYKVLRIKCENKDVVIRENAYLFN
jgi:hypothetical protein